MLIFKLNLVILFQHILLGKFGVLDKGLGNLRVFFYLVFISEKVVKNLKGLLKICIVRDWFYVTQIKILLCDFLKFLVDFTMPRFLLLGFKAFIKLERYLTLIMFMFCINFNLLS